MRTFLEFTYSELFITFMPMSTSFADVDVIIEMDSYLRLLQFGPQPTSPFRGTVWVGPLLFANLTWKVGSCMLKTHLCLGHSVRFRFWWLNSLVYGDVFVTWTTWWGRSLIEEAWLSIDIILMNYHLPLLTNHMTQIQASFAVGKCRRLPEHRP